MALVLAAGVAGLLALLNVDGGAVASPPEACRFLAYQAKPDDVLVITRWRPQDEACQLGPLFFTVKNVGPKSIKDAFITFYRPTAGRCGKYWNLASLALHVAPRAALASGMEVEVTLARRDVRWMRDYSQECEGQRFEVAVSQVSFTDGTFWPESEMRMREAIRRRNERSKRSR